MMTDYVKTTDRMEAGGEAEQVVPAGRGRWLRIGLLALLLTAAAGSVGWWLGSSGDATATPAIVEQWEDAWLSADPDAVAAVYAEDATWWVAGDAERIEGRAAIRGNAEFTNRWMTFEEFDHHTVIVGDGVIVVESTWHGDSRPAGGADMTPYSAEAVTVFEVEDGLITRSDYYIDLDEVFNQGR